MKRQCAFLFGVFLLQQLLGAQAEAKAPKKFCDCPAHTEPVTSASVSDGSSYKLFAYNDAYQVAPKDNGWCYTRAVWFEAVRTGGRFEWRANGRQVMSGAIVASDDACGASYNHFSWVGSPGDGPSTLTHGARLETSKDIALYYAKSVEFTPSWPERLKTLFSSLVGFGHLPQSATPSRIAIRVTSKVRGSAPPFTIDYTIESPTRTSINLLPLNRTQPSTAQYPRLHWEAAISTQFYTAMEQQRRGFVDGGARTDITVAGLQVVEVSIGRLLLLPPAVAPPGLGAEAKDAILVGYAPAFRAVSPQTKSGGTIIGGGVTIKGELR